jgi:hypothetical protein
VKTQQLAVLAVLVLVAWVFVLRFWIIPKYLRPHIHAAASHVPRVLLIFLIPPFVVFGQWLRNHNTETWLYGFGAATGLVLGVLVWLAPPNLKGRPRT